MTIAPKYLPVILAVVAIAAPACHYDYWVLRSARSNYEKCTAEHGLLRAECEEKRLALIRLKEEWEQPTADPSQSTGSPPDHRAVRPREARQTNG